MATAKLTENQQQPSDPPERTKFTPQSLSNKFPDLVNKTKIWSCILEAHEFRYKMESSPNAKKLFQRFGKCPQNNIECKLCRNHVDEMCVWNGEISSNNPASQPEDLNHYICRKKDFLFLLYCTHCDEVMMGFLKGHFNDLTEIKFGLEGNDECKPTEKSHNKMNIRCMIIDNNSFRIRKWKDTLQIEIIEISKAKEVAAWELKLKHHSFNPFREGITSKELDPKTYDIIYLIKCKICLEKRYVGQTTRSFQGRYLKGMASAHKDSLVYKHFIGGDSDCTDEDYLWAVIDDLSEEQQMFLKIWAESLKKLDVEVIGKVCKVIKEDLKEHKEMLINIFRYNNADEAAAKVMDELRDVQATENKLKDLQVKNAKYMKNTTKLFLSDKESEWIKTLKTLETFGGMNKRDENTKKHKTDNLYFKN